MRGIEGWETEGWRTVRVRVRGVQITTDNRWITRITGEGGRG